MPDHKDIGLTHVALPCADLDKTIDFYARYAGMEVVHRRENDGSKVVWLSDRTRPFVVVFLETSNIPHPLGPFSHLGVGFESRADVDALVAQARAEGLEVEGPTDSGPPVGYWAFIRDPDGHTLEVTHGQEVHLTLAESRST